MDDPALNNFETVMKWGLIFRKQSLCPLYQVYSLKGLWPYLVWVISPRFSIKDDCEFCHLLSAEANLGAGVAAISIGRSQVKGLLRFVQSNASTCIVEGTLDGLPISGPVHLSIHETGDVSNGCESCGPPLAQEDCKVKLYFGKDCPLQPKSLHGSFVYMILVFQGFSVKALLSLWEQLCIQSKKVYKTV